MFNTRLFICLGLIAVIAIAYVVTIPKGLQAGHEDELPPAQLRNVTPTLQDGHVEVAWDPPSFNSHRPVDSYSIWRQDGDGVPFELTSGGVQKTAAVILYRDSYNLVEGTIYSYRVQAHNDYGDGPLSAETSSSRVTWPSVPQEVADSLTVEWQEGSQLGMLLTWTVPANIRITQYQVYRSYSPNQRGLLLGALDATPFVTGEAVTFFNKASFTLSDPDETKLVQSDEEQPLYYTVEAQNEAGPGPNSATASATLPVRPPLQIPYAVTDFRVEQVWDGIRLSWDYPELDSAHPVSSFTVKRSEDAGETFALKGFGVAHERGWLDYNADLQVGQEYHYLVRSANSEGGTDSELLSVVYQGAPTRTVVAEWEEGVGVTITWEESPAVAPSHKYRVYRGVGQGIYNFDKLLDATADSWTDTSIRQMETDQTIHYLVRFERQYPVPTPSVTLKIPRIEIEAPRAPTNVQATLLSSTDVRVTWRHPSVDLTHPIDSYFILYGTTEDTERYDLVGWVSRNRTEFIDMWKGKESNRTYYYVVESGNNRGRTASSRSNGVHWTAPTPTAVPVIVRPTATPTPTPTVTPIPRDYYTEPTLPESLVRNYTEGDRVSIQLPNADRTNDKPFATPLEYSVNGLPAWLTYNDSSKRVTGLASESRRNTFVYIVEDAMGNRAFMHITINVRAPVQPTAQFCPHYHIQRTNGIGNSRVTTYDYAEMRCFASMEEFRTSLQNRTPSEEDRYHVGDQPTAPHSHGDDTNHGGVPHSHSNLPEPTAD